MPSERLGSQIKDASLVKKMDVRHAAADQGGECVQVTVGALWCTHYSGSVRALKYRRLRYAYRAPAFFADESLRSGMSVEFLRFDADFETRDVDGSTSALAETVDIVYVSCHGTTGNHGYSAILCSSDWLPAAAGTGASRPVVIVFDTCDLIDLGDPAWRRHWQVPTVGAGLRLLLGFSSPATVGEATSLRGRAFVENLARGDTFVDAWTGAIVRTRYQGTDQAVALAFGDSAQDASSVLRTASLLAMPAPRASLSPIVVRYP
ncbi:MAG: hypothetical protein QOD83_2907 [Solirubrobacteraceae bacterium]|nr:hypothetical protein [Solirubrobacteraceae bacterium]